MNSGPYHANMFNIFVCRGQSVDNSYEQPATQNYSDWLQSGEAHRLAG